MSNQGKPQPLRLLKSAPSKEYKRLIVRYPYQTDIDYANAYHFSAKRLAGTFSGQPVDDLLLLPFLTLYRQAFELQLKNTIRYLAGVRMTYIEGRTPELVDAVSEKHFMNDLKHNLHKLLNEVKEHYIKLNLPEEFPKTVETMVLNLHEADKAGTAFRYAGLLPESQDYADFPNLAEQLDTEFTLLTVVRDVAEGTYDPMPTLRDLESDMH